MSAQHTPGPSKAAPWWSSCPYLRTYRPRKGDRDWMVPMVVVRYKVSGRWYSTRYTLGQYVEYRARCRAEHAGWDGKPAFVIGSLATHGSMVTPRTCFDGSPRCTDETGAESLHCGCAEADSAAIAKATGSAV